MKLRIKFSKHGELCFIGHLDVMRYFQKAIRRAEIDIAYTEGFSPHQKMSFASPLGLGLYTDGDYFDIEVNTMTTSADIVDRLNAVMAEGMRVINCSALPDGNKYNAMATLAAADYEVMISDALMEKFGGFEKLASAWESFIALDSIITVKESKSGERECDIRPLIRSGHIDGNVLSVNVAAGSRDNLKPETIMKALFEYCDIDETSEHAKNYEDIIIIRKEMYAIENDQMIPLCEIGEQIL